MDKELRMRAHEAAVEGAELVRLAEKINKDLALTGSEDMTGLMMDIPVEVVLNFGKTMQDILNLLVELGAIDEAKVKKAAKKLHEDRLNEAAANRVDDATPGCDCERCTAVRKLQEANSEASSGMVLFPIGGDLSSLPKSLRQILAAMGMPGDKLGSEVGAPEEPLPEVNAPSSSKIH